MGIPVEGASQVLYDNKSIVLSTSLSSCMQKKKHKAITHHQVRETVAASIVKVSHIASTENVLADILTKPTDEPTYRRHIKSTLVILKLSDDIT